MGNPVASRQSRTARRFSVGPCFLSALCEGFDVQTAVSAADSGPRSRGMRSLLEVLVSVSGARSRVSRTGQSTAS
jgi:hypothetical protein